MKSHIFEIGMKHIGTYINHGNHRERYQAEATLNTTSFCIVIQFTSCNFGIEYLLH